MNFTLKMEGLEDNANARTAKTGEAIFIQGPQIFAINMNRARIRSLQTCHCHQQG